MLPNRIVLIVVLLVYHTRTTSPLWRPYYDRYHLTITDRVQYYRLAYVIQKYALSGYWSLSLCTTPMYLVIITMCNPVTSWLNRSRSFGLDAYVEWEDFLVFDTHSDHDVMVIYAHLIGRTRCLGKLMLPHPCNSGHFCHIDCTKLYWILQG